MFEVGYNANHIEDEGSNNDDGDNDGYQMAGLRDFTLSLSLYVCVWRWVA